MNPAAVEIARILLVFEIERQQKAVAAPTIRQDSDAAAAERQASTHVARPGNSTPRLARRQRAGVR